MSSKITPPAQAADSTEPVAEIVECEKMGQQTVREIDGRWKFLPYGTKLVVSAEAVPPASCAPAAWTDVMAERQRQISAEGWTPEHDDEHQGGEMAQAAARYILATRQGECPWPWDSSWYKPRDERSNLVRAAALVIAELERIDRAKARTRPDDFPTWICSRCPNPGYCSGSLQGCDIEEMSK